MAHYKLGAIEIGGVPNLIVCDSSVNPCFQNSGCSCALIAIANYLILGGSAKFHNRVEGEDVTDVDITNLIARSSAALSFKSLSILGSLSTSGLHLDPALESPIMFSDTDEWKLFMNLSVRVLHINIIDSSSQSDLYNTFHNMSLDDMIESIGGRNSHFEEVKNLMHETGLSFLPQHMEDGKLAILYTDNHFSIIHKYKGAIFTLETDHNVLANLPRATWKALNMRDKFYLTSQYNPTPKQPKFNQAQEWCDAKLAENLRELGGTAEMRGEQKRKNKKKRRGAES